MGPDYEEIKVVEHLVELNHIGEVMWRQRAKIRWMPEGGSNSRFFHQKARGRTKKNHICKLVREDGMLTESSDEMSDMAIEFYKKLYTSKGVNQLHEVRDAVQFKVDGAMNAKLLEP
jgi:hypothetical protein